MNPAHLVVETYQTEASDFDLKPEHVRPLQLLQEAMKEDGRHPRESRADCLEALEGETRKLAEEAIHLRKQAQYAEKGWCWRCRIIDTSTGETVYVSPMATRTQHHAQRIGQRHIKRYERHRDFDKPIGVVATIK